MTFAAGLATEGLKPVVAIYSTFLQRAYDQLIHDVALQNLPVVFAIDRAGLVGGDGATHQGSYDLSLPALHTQHGDHGAGGRERVPPDALHRHHARTARRRCVTRAAAVRASRSQKEMSALPLGKAQLRREGRSGLALLAFGAMVAAGAGDRRAPRRDARQHALRQTAR